MKTAIAVAAVLILAAVALAQTAPAPTCEGVPKPAATVEYVLEPNAPKYAGPACLEGETCTTPAGWDTREFLADGTTARHRFTYAGELRAVERNGRWESDELVMLPAAAPVCWAWQWRPVP